MNISVIGGLGHVGLPLSLQLASVGHNVEIVDTDKTAVDLFKKGQARFVEDGIEREISTYMDLIKLSDEPKYDVVIIATNSDNLSGIITGLEDRLILIRQTVKVGTIRHLREHYRVNYVPERLAQGKALDEIKIMPQLVGCEDDEEYEMIKGIFNWVECIRLNYEEAELAKLFCNYYRYGTFALANDMYIMCTRLNADFNKVRNAVMKDYPRMSGFPIAGFTGGYCLPKDTTYLIPNSLTKLCHSVLEVNVEYFVRAVVRQVLSFNPKTIGILGVTSKADIDDVRGSIVLNSLLPYLRMSLGRSDVKVVYYDPFVECVKLEDVMACDVIIIGTPHSFIKELDFSGKVVMDPWGYVK